MLKAPHSLRIAAGAGLLALCAVANAAVASGIAVRVLDRDGAPVPEVAVFAVPLDTGESIQHGNQRAIMNQRDLTFEPHLLIVETGTEIEFPNQDDVRHHVYSFSPARKLDLHIASGGIESPLIFPKAGVVTLGCNIHDDMLAYIRVVDTPYFAKTDAEGSAELAGLPPGRYQLNIWTPRVAAQHLPDPVAIEILAGETAQWQHQFAAKLYPPHQHSETSLHWSQY